MVLSFPFIFGFPNAFPVTQFVTFFSFGVLEFCFQCPGFLSLGVHCVCLAFPFSLSWSVVTHSNWSYMVL